MMGALQSLYHEKLLEWLDAYGRTEPVARLREVGMNCGYEYTAFPLFSDLSSYSQYDHSLGTAESFGILQPHGTRLLQPCSMTLQHRFLPM